jgi:probable phosphoglycerate mutase
MAEAGARLSGWMAGLPARHRDATVAAVSHADVIKAGLCGALGLTLDAHWRFRVAPASLSALLLAEGRTEVVTVNEELAGDG